MESLYARDTPTAQELKLKLAERNQVIEDGQVTLKPLDHSNNEQRPPETLDSIMETPTESNTNAEATNAPNTAATTTDDAFGFNFSSLPREELEDQWRASQGAEDGRAPPGEDKKTEEARIAELSRDTSSLSTSDSDKTETKSSETSQAIQGETPATSTTSEATQPRRAGVASMPRKAKPAITINTGSGSSGVGSKRPPPTPVSPPIFSWTDILRVQNLIERCLQQYLSKKLEEQNPTFFRAYSLQLQLKEQIIAFNYLVRPRIPENIIFYLKTKRCSAYRSVSRRRWQQKEANGFCITAT
ncbi:uncharacterized protein PITG_03975 [Phytophthora infestans T30-4]|uniref:Uncharacterized protein n=1 Tax=Phytophthora infestans (strain T30-4) TaxID=403677 RepID=D0MZ08_PHYIT|nr:uncharacterized protein PITG_03975 [Phytophthora infestans T30-4]EEY66406.1 conserved hypothetical protein [Phytophthora infestans T30-4]|eukprot:XP_002907005.1 conserved hypothetical protein [Phytophthora infestans T30-4]